MLKAAIEKANKLVGGWPDREAIIAMLEGLVIAAPSGYVYIRPGDHQAFKDIAVGFKQEDAPDYPFPVWDPDTVEVFPVKKHHGSARLADARRRAQRPVPRLQLDQDDLADYQRLARLRLRPTRHVVPFLGARASCPQRAEGPRLFKRARCPRSQDTSRNTWLNSKDDGASRSPVRT